MTATAFVDACGFIPASSGTGDFVVSSAVQGYQTPASAGAVNAAVYSYRAESPDKSQWEEGFGAYTSGTTTLARTTVTANNLGTTAKISFSAAPNVYITAATADLQNASLLTSGTLPIGRLSLSPTTGALGADVNISNSVYTDGPSINVGTSGVWLVIAKVNFTDTAGACQIKLKLWDGTTIMDSADDHVTLTGDFFSCTLAGIITNPAANLRVSGLTNAAASTTSMFKFNVSGNSKDCSILAIRIG